MLSDLEKEKNWEEYEKDKDEYDRDPSNNTEPQRPKEYDYLEFDTADGIVNKIDDIKKNLEENKYVL